jgi:hypothetical protein
MSGRYLDWQLHTALYHRKVKQEYQRNLGFHHLLDLFWWLLWTRIVRLKKRQRFDTNRYHGDKPP